MYYNIKLKTVHYHDSLQWLRIRYQIQAGHFMGTRNSCQLQKHYYDSMKKKELYYLKEKSSYLLVHLYEVFEKRLLHFLPYFSWHCPSPSVKILPIFDNIINPKHYKSWTNTYQSTASSLSALLWKTLHTHAQGSYIFPKSIIILEEWSHFCVSS
jgi:hypothetical protein